MGRLLEQQHSAHVNRDVGGDANIVDLWIELAQIRSCTGMIPCNGATWGTLRSSYILRKIGE